MIRALAPALLALAASACAAVDPSPAVPAPPAAVVADTSRVYTVDQVTTPPVFTNVPDVVRQMARNHPPLMRDAARGGTVVLMVHVGRDGRVRGARVHRSSGDAGMDETAVRVASRLRGRAARIGDTPVAVEVEIPLDFGIGP